MVETLRDGNACDAWDEPEGQVKDHPSASRFKALRDVSRSAKVLEAASIGCFASICHWEAAGDRSAASALRIYALAESTHGFTAN